MTSPFCQVSPELAFLVGMLHIMYFRLIITGQIEKIWRDGNNSYLLKINEKPDPSNIKLTQIADHFMNVVSIPEAVRRKTSDGFKRIHKIYKFLSDSQTLNDFF